MARTTTEVRTEIAWAVQACQQVAERLNALLEPETEPRQWAFPVGTAEYPPETWYCAQYHTWDRVSGAHTGIDLNLDKSPWGDVDRGMPVYAVSDGTVHDVGQSASWLGVVVIRHEHEGAPLWVRYAHLADVQVKAGQDVRAGDCLGVIGNYTATDGGGDHLHCDMALDPFGWNFWKTRTVRWVDPAPVLRAHLDPARVDAMLKQGG